jgi:hypothetical protein
MPNLVYKSISQFHDVIPEFDSILRGSSLSGKCTSEICDSLVSPWMVFDQWMLTPLGFPATASHRWPRLEADCLNHEILLAKLHLYGIRGLYEGWFRSYWTDRRQKVEVTTPNSFFFWQEYIETLSSHGSILGSLFFHNVYKWVMSWFQAEISKSSPQCLWNSIQRINHVLHYILVINHNV